MSSSEFDSILFVSFGGPEAEADVMPFLRTVTAGRDIPDERLAGVAEHYLSRGGRSPINDQNRALIDALSRELTERDIDLPIYWGNRNWHPFLEEAMTKMVADGRKNAIAFVTSAYSSFSGCRQYRQDIARAAEASGATNVTVHKLRQFFNHPGFVNPFAESLRRCFDDLGKPAHVLFTAHSIPVSMAQGCRYESQLLETSRLVAAAAGELPGWDLVYQSRSGRPQDPWLEPDVNDALKDLAAKGVESVVLCPIGFVSDHMEVVHDLDDEAVETARDLGIELRRARTPGTHPEFVSMIAELVLEQTEQRSPSVVGEMGAVGCLGDSCCPARTAN